MPTKYVVVLGSIMSGLGKGIVTSSILKILKFYHYRASPIKFDGYLNYDCGTMNPYRHGEVFVLDDKSEVDMDFGNYERFLNTNLNGSHSITGGKLFSTIVEKERRGDFLGEDVQFIPHMISEIINRVKSVAKQDKADVVVIEVGGTVGDIENSYFIEAMRQLALTETVIFVDVTYVPQLSVVGEQKTKPTQVAFRMLMQTGVKPNFIVCRSENKLEEKTKSKLAMFTNLVPERIIDDSNIETTYAVPLSFMRQGFDKLLLKDLGLKERPIDKKAVSEWEQIVNNILNPNGVVEIGIVGKYTNLHDSYASLTEALIHAGAYHKVRVKIKWIESTEIENKGAREILEGLNGIIVPGGFGSRGIEGMISAIQYARENKIPYLGLCLGMQLMSIEYARNVCNLKGANSTEFEKNAKYKVIDLMPSQRGIKKKGATMRLGAWSCKIIDKNSIAYASYKSNIISERHRHRYELNNKYRDILSKNGLLISGVTLDNSLVEIVEWRESFGVATQAHPELKSRPEAPAPLFLSFIGASIDFMKRKNQAVK